GTDAEAAGWVAVHGAFALVEGHDATFTSRHFLDRARCSLAQPIAQQVPRIVQVLAHVAPQAAMKWLAVDAQQIAPGIPATEHGVARHHRRERTEGHAIARKAGGD